MFDDTRVGMAGSVFVDVTAPAVTATRLDTALDPPRAVTSRGHYERFIKPVIDRAGAAVLLVVFLPVMFIVAAVVRISLGRGVIFKQQRIGRNGSRFCVYKFRTMHPDARRAQLPIDGPDRRVSHKSRNDPRLTPVGRSLRGWSLDELPQLWNVLRAEMSLVGPRPEIPAVVERYQPWQNTRHLVKPGLTGYWQVRARGDGRLMHECADLDIAYVKSIGFVTDLKILALTIPALLIRRGF